MIRFLPPRRRRLINLARDGSAITRISPPPGLKEDHRRPAAAAQPVHQSSTVNNEPTTPRPRRPRHPPLASNLRTAAGRRSRCQHQSESSLIFITTRAPFPFGPIPTAVTYRSPTPRVRNRTAGRRRKKNGSTVIFPNDPADGQREFVSFKTRLGTVIQASPDTKHVHETTGTSLILGLN